MEQIDETQNLKIPKQEKSERTKLITFFSALCLFLSAVEYAIPKPLPFLRLGLANLPVILSLSVLKKREIALVVLFKVVAQGVISGTIFSYIFVFSAAGSFSSVFVMILVNSIFRSKISSVGISLSGALANNLAQLLVARFILFGQNTKYIAPLLLITGFVTGTLLGVFTELFKQKSKWFKIVASSPTMTSIASEAKSNVIASKPTSNVIASEPKSNVITEQTLTVIASEAKQSHQNGNNI